MSLLWILSQVQDNIVTYKERLTTYKGRLDKLDENHIQIFQKNYCKLRLLLKKFLRNCNSKITLHHKDGITLR